MALLCSETLSTLRCPDPYLDAYSSRPVYRYLVRTIIPLASLDMHVMQPVILAGIDEKYTLTESGMAGVSFA